MKVRSLLLLIAAALPASAAAPSVVNGIAARVNDTVITFMDVTDASMMDMQQLARMPGTRTPAMKERADQLNSAALQNLVDRQMILDDFKTAGYQLPDKIVEDEVQQAIREQFGDRVTMIKSLQKEGLTFEEYRKRVREKFIIGAMTGKNVSGEVIISPYKVEKYYADHQEQFKTQEELTLRMIVLANKPDRDAEATRKLAAEVLAKVRAGTPFADAAKTYSDGSQRSEGGLWPKVDRKTLREDLGEIAFKLPAGTISDVIERPDGCYIMKVEEVRPAGIRSLNDVSSDIERQLENEERQQLRKQWIDRLKNKSFVRYFPTN